MGLPPFRAARTAGRLVLAMPLLLATQPALAVPAVLVGGQDASVPVAVMPQAPSPVGLPRLADRVSCPGLQQAIAALVGAESPVWSITVADAQGRLLADINGMRPRVPASNQKLISTAYALDRLGPDHRLRTRLWRLGDGTLRLTGEGDPDLALPQLQRFAKLALGSGGGSGPIPSLLRLELAEEPRHSWWPQGWNPDDRYYAYGAPITRLAITSNAIHEAVLNPPSRLQTLLERTIRQQGAQAQLALVPAQADLPADAVLLHEEPSTSMHGLLSLANNDSHNFTAEVLLRQAAGSWDLGEVQRRTWLWLREQGLPLDGVRIADGSGLDRGNRLTSRALAALLLRMDQHPYGRSYLASMAIAGQRGTLRDFQVGSPLQGRFHGKTGTLRGVRAISGVLLTPSGPRYVSAISNGGGNPNGTIGQILRQALLGDNCPAG
ncbi:MAG: D-alanyl-D-alanine carboxypeptidase/D-alanyl-D-alanine-endopeptidase [Cyanobacteriota bacterium]